MKTPLIIATITALATMIGAYFTSSAAITDKLNQTATIINSSISDDRQRITAVETDLNNIKALQLETRNDVKEIIRILK